jgi:aryl-alcohol dehydrogenase-like predicted oxidoreductase
MPELRQLRTFVAWRRAELHPRGVEAEVLPTARELGIGLTAYGVLSRGVLSGHWSSDRALTDHDFRSFAPRFQGVNPEHNLALVDWLREIAWDKDATVAQIAIAWVLTRGDDIVPTVGARRRDRLHEALGALDVELTDADLTRIDDTFPAGAAAGERYPAFAVAELDSERRAA